jgi:hypothetical protein
MPGKRKVPPAPAKDSAAGSKVAKQSTLGFAKKLEDAGVRDAVSVPERSKKSKPLLKKPMVGLSGVSDSFIASQFIAASAKRSRPSAQFVNAFRSQAPFPAAPHPWNAPATPNISEYNGDRKEKGKAKSEIVEIGDSSSDDDVRMDVEGAAEEDERRMQMWTELYAPDSSVSSD